MENNAVGKGCLHRLIETQGQFFTLQTNEFPVSVLWTAWLLYKVLPVKAWALVREVLVWKQPSESQADSRPWGLVW